MGKTGDTLWSAAQAVLAAWDDPANRTTDIAGAMDAPIARLRATLAGHGTAHGPRRDTKRAQVLEMLRYEGGASGPQIAEATGWAPHTVRGFLAGLAKGGIAVSVLKRVHHLGSDNTSAKRNYTVYRIVDEPRT